MLWVPVILVETPQTSEAGDRAAGHNLVILTLRPRVPTSTIRVGQKTCAGAQCQAASLATGSQPHAPIILGNTHRTRKRGASSMLLETA